MTQLVFFASAYFATAMALAAVSEIRELCVPRVLSLGLLTGMPVWHLASGLPMEGSAVGAAVILAGGLMLRAGRLVRGAHVLFAAAAALWLPFAALQSFVLATAGAAALLEVLRVGVPRTLCAGDGSPLPDAREPAPGVAIAIGALFAFPWAGV